MTRTAAVVMVVLAGGLSSAYAQAVPKVEVFGGYSALVDDGVIHGWQSSLAINPGAKFGIVADFAGYYSDGLRFHQFLFGPQFNGRVGRVNPFAHGLIGFERSSGNHVSSDTNLALGLGGGLDVKISGPLSIRALQFDWVPIKYSDWSTSTTRFGVGIVIGFGQ